MTDGYFVCDTNLTETKFVLSELTQRYISQLKLNEKMHKVIEEINSMENFPKDVNLWIQSLSVSSLNDVNKSNNFSLKDYKKMCLLRKQHDSILNETETNKNKIKELIIEELLEKINKITEK